MTERVDTFKLSDKSFELPVMGTFEVRNGKINAWRDYFDTNQFISQMGDHPLQVRDSSKSRAVFSLVKGL
jgi:limonene-1,2-epoxide hydrolase